MQERISAMGRMTPVQMEMLMLAGLLELPESATHSSDEMQWKLIQSGRTSLVKRCGCDFLFDLKAWHDFLLTSPNQGYGYCVSGCQGIQDAVLSMQNDTARQALISTYVANTETKITPES